MSGIAARIGVFALFLLILAASFTPWVSALIQIVATLGFLAVIAVGIWTFFFMPADLTPQSLWIEKHNANAAVERARLEKLADEEAAEAQRTREITVTDRLDYLGLSEEDDDARTS